MSKIILQQLDFSTLGYPVGTYTLGIDVADGLPKLRTPGDTIILGLTGSNYIQYKEVTYSQFISLLNSSSLISGGYYLITDFTTKHYIQYTDSNGNGTANDEDIKTGSTEELLVTAISENNYDRRVVSIQYPSDEIYWKHNPSDRESEHAISGSKGLIYSRKSADGNERDYDFRNVIFRRWNDGNGNYKIFRAIDSPGWPSGMLLLDYIDFKSFEEGYQIMRNNKVGSMSDIPNALSVPYYMDNLVFSTFSQAYDNEIGECHGVTIDTLDFTANKISLLGSSKFINQSFEFSYNNFFLVVGSDFSSLLYNNNVNMIISSTMTGDFIQNSGVYIIDSKFESAKGNRFTNIVSCSFSHFHYNNLFTDINSIADTTFSYRIIKDTSTFSQQNYIDFSNDLGKVLYLSSESYPSLSIGTNSTDYVLNISNYSKEFLSISNEGTFSFNGNELNIIGSQSYLSLNNSGFDVTLGITSSSFTLNGITNSIFNIDYTGTISIATPSTSTSNNFLIIDDNLVKSREVNIFYNVYDVNVMTYSATISNTGRDYFGIGYTSSSCTFNLPSISTVDDGQLVTIKDETGAASVNPIIINTNGSDTLDGNTQSQLAINYGSLSFVKKLNGWWFI